MMEKYPKMRELFIAACDLSPQDQMGLLDEQCNDPGIRAALEKMLQIDGSNEEQMLDKAQTVDIQFACDTVVETKLPSRIGGYRIQRILGQGGMGIVYLARQDNPQRDVALKVIQPGILSRELRNRFEFEATVLGRLQHPGIAQIHEAGIHDDGAEGRPFFAMDYVDGSSLHEYVKSRNPSLPERLKMILQICDALQHAHQRGVVHRDLKPGNILVDREGKIKIVDFGVARCLDEEMKFQSMATVTGQMVGTLAYMSPEQLSGNRNVLPSSDVYSMGAILYELLTGQLPFRAGNISEFVRLVKQTDPKQPSTLNAKIPRDLEVICLRCLIREPQKRFANAGELADELQRFQQGLPILSRPCGRLERGARWCRRHPMEAGLWAAFSLALSVGIAGICWQWREANLQARVAIAGQKQSDENFRKARSAIDNLTELSLKLSNVVGAQEVQKQALEEVLAFYQENLPADEAEDEFRGELAHTCRKMGDIRSQLLDVENAIADYEIASRLFQSLAVDFPQNIAWQNEFGRCLVQIAGWQMKSEAPKPALENFLQAAKLFGEIFDRTNEEEFLISQANALMNVSAAARAVGVTDQIESSIAESLVLLNSCADQSTNRFRMTHSLALYQFSRLLSEQEKDDEAIKTIESACGILEQAIQNGATAIDGNAMSYLAVLYASRTQWHFESNPSGDAWKESARKAIEGIGPAWRARPDLPQIGLAYARIFEYAGNFYWLSGDEAQAKTNYERAIEVFADLHFRFPVYASSGLIHCRLLGTCPVASARNVEAAFQILEQLKTTAPNDPNRIWDEIVLETLHRDWETAESKLKENRQLFYPETAVALDKLIRSRQGILVSETELQSLGISKEMYRDHILIQQIKEMILENISAKNQ